MNKHCDCRPNAGLQTMYNMHCPNPEHSAKARRSLEMTTGGKIKLCALPGCGDLSRPGDSYCSENCKGLHYYQQHPEANREKADAVLALAINEDRVDEIALAAFHSEGSLTQEEAARIGARALAQAIRRILS